ncbi:endonuclease [Patescibacteria group bacterium]|nr:endonuclease [Patescibacteria group bacterium]
MTEYILTFSFLLILILLFLYINIRKKYQVLQHSKKSQSSRYGKMTEQFLPFLDDYPYDPRDFRFLGTPIDGVQFEDDKVVLIEFKTAQSQLSPKQKNVRRLVEEGKVEFEEHRIE